MSRKQESYLTDTCHLHVPCHFSSRSRSSLKSHSSTCLSSPYENRFFEGGGPWLKDDDRPTLLTPSPRPDQKWRDPRHSPIKKKKKKVYTIDVPNTSVRAKHHKCHKAAARRQRLHSDGSNHINKKSTISKDGEQSKKARLAIVVIALVLVMLSIFLVGITLRMAPVIDALVAKQNEEIFRSMANAGNTAPPTEGAPVNDTVTSNGQPG